MLRSQVARAAQVYTSSARTIFTSTAALLGSKRFRAFNPVIQYSHNKKRVKLSAFKDVPFFSPDESVPLDLPPPAPYDYNYLPEEFRDSRVADKNRKFSMRKRFFYERNRTILDKAKLIVIIQPMGDDAFATIMERLGDAFYTSHFRNGLVHIEDKSYAPIKTLFKGPIRVLLQDKEEEIIPSLRKLKAVLKEFPETLYLGGAADGGAGLQEDLEALLDYQSKNHIQGALIGILNSVSELCRVMDHPTMSLARVMDHHGNEIAKNEQPSA